MTEVIEKTEYKKGYKKTKLGWIPEKWEVKKLGDFGNFKNGISKGGENFGFGTPIIGLNDVFGKFYIKENNLNSLVNASEQELIDFNLNKGDVLFVRSSVKPEGVGLPCVVESNLEKTTFSGFLIRFRDTKGSLNDKYKRYCFLLENFRHRLLSKSTISANTNINQPSLASLNMIIPSLKEQEKIAEILSAWDDGIETLEKLIEQKEIFHKALMKNLLIGKIRLFGFSKISEYKRTKLGLIPVDWQVKPLKLLFDKRMQKYSGNTEYNIFTNSATKGIVLQNKYFDRRIVTEENTSNYYVVREDDFMYNPRISQSAPAGPINRNKLGITGIASPLYTIFKAKHDTIVDFYEQYFSSNLWNNSMFIVANQGARHDRLNITSNDFMNMPLPYPPIKEQEKIANILIESYKEIQILNSKLEKLKDQKKGLMQKLLTGQIRVKV